MTWELFRKSFFKFNTFGFWDLLIPRASCSQNSWGGLLLGVEVDEEACLTELFDEPLASTGKEEMIV